MEKRVLIERWLRSETSALPIYDEASVSSARQFVRDTGQRLGLDKDLIESAALIASELTHNQLAHARQGYFLVNSAEREGSKGLEIIAADIGPGIREPRVALKDANATQGSIGAGLGAVSRMADEVEMDNRIEEGLCVVARKFEAQANGREHDVAIMGHPYPGEAISGDDAVCLQTSSGFIAAVCDGLGHGPEARHASNQAIETLSGKRDAPLDQLLSDMDTVLTTTRGCAMSVVRFNRDDRMLESVSIGDVHSHLYHLKDAHFFTAIPMVLGACQFHRQRIRIEKLFVERGSVLVMFTDGLKSRTNLKGQLEVLRQPAILIAEHLLQTQSRPDDDALVLVTRFVR